MPEGLHGAPASWAEIRRAVLHGLGRLPGGLRVVAEDVLGVTTRIDAVAVDDRGDGSVVLIAGEPDDPALLTRALAARAWLQPRIPDWRKLAPELALRPGAAVRALALAPDFGAELHAAVASLPSGLVQLVRYGTLRVGDGLEVVIEAPATCQASGATSAAHGPVPPLPPPRFRSGLSEDDLTLTREERKHFE